MNRKVKKKVAPKKVDKRIFRNTAKQTRIINLTSAPSRGGIRLWSVTSIQILGLVNRCILCLMKILPILMIVFFVVFVLSVINVY